MWTSGWLRRLWLGFVGWGLVGANLRADHLRDLQGRAIQEKAAAVGHWGWDAENYLLWSSHSNRLIPVYTFGTKGAGDGIDLASYTGENSPYRSPRELERLYGRVPPRTLSEQAEYLDQTNIFDLQQAALDAGRKHIILFLFDGMDWQTTQAAAIYNLRRLAYDAGRGTGTHFQDYQAAGTTQFGFMVTSPLDDESTIDVNRQTARPVDHPVLGGYDPQRGGAVPWAPPNDAQYLVGEPKTDADRHAYADSASAATSMTTGIKTYNAAIGVDVEGKPVPTIAHHAQERGYRVGVVSSVPISHATPAAAYAHNVGRDDFQDLTRDLLGLPSISHAVEPLLGMDVVIGCGYGQERDKDAGQGQNFVPGNAYLTAEDLRRVDVAHGGRYLVVTRTSRESGAKLLEQAADTAAAQDRRLLGFFGAVGGHLPYQTADGRFEPAPGRKKTAETYSDADVAENPTLAEMTRAALTVLSDSPRGFWLMVEAGDVDWANHDNNLDTAIGAVNSGDEAFRVVTDWVEKHSNWSETVVILTADHGHFLVLERPELLIPTP